MFWEGLINLYDRYDDICPIAHTYITAHIGVLVDKDGDFLCAKDVSKVHELVPVPCTVASEPRTSNVAPHLLSDNLAYVCEYPGYKERHELYMEQLQRYVSCKLDDAYAKAIYAYALKGTLLTDIDDILSLEWHVPKHKINILFVVYGLPNEGRDDLWTDYYLKTLPQNGICSISGVKDHIPESYPARLISQDGMERMFMSDSGVGYVASQKICHALQWLTYGRNNKRSVILDELKGDGNNLIRTRHGLMIDFDVALTQMDNDIKKSVTNDIAFCENQQFYNEYVKRHIEKFGAGSWILDQIK